MLSKIIYGKNGCTNPLAKNYIKDALCVGKGGPACDCVSCRAVNHPDFLQSDGVLMEQIEEVLTFSTIPPMIAKQKVCLITEFHDMMPLVQTKLLKLLEEQSNFVLIATAENPERVLDTVKSRTESVFVKPMNKPDFLAAGGDLVDYYMTGGYWDLIPVMKELKPLYQEVLQAFVTADGIKLIQTLGLHKENDKSVYFEQFKQDVYNLFSFMLALPFAILSQEFQATSMSAKKTLALSAVIQEQLEFAKGKQYAKTDFFTGICKIADVLNK